MSMWYKDWFDSDYYHLLYQNRNEEEAEQFVNSISNYLKLNPGMKVLDLPCGKGRHAHYLSKKGFNVFAADLSSNSIRIAESESKGGVKFLVHDMLHEFPENNFDAIFNIFTSFGYFENEEDDLKVLSNFKKCLKKDGYLVIDFLNPDDVIKNLACTGKIKIDNISFSISKTIINGFVEKTITLETPKESCQFKEKVKLLRLNDFKRLLNATGLQIITTFGSYQLDAFEAKSSERLIIIASH